MTVVAGYVAADGALLGADCRLTVSPPGAASFSSDTAQKIIRLGPASAIGYSGDVLTVSDLLGNLWPELGRRRADPLSLRLWVPRVLRHSYRRLGQLHYPVGSVKFLVASSIRGKPTRILKRRVWEFFSDAPLHGFANYLALRIGPNFNAPGDYYEIPGSSMGMLYRMDSPNFEPVDCPPLSSAAIGSGASARENLQAYELLLATGHPSRTASWFVDAMMGFLHETEVTTVGGWLLGAQLIDGGVRSLAYQYDPSGQNHEVGIRLREGRFVLDAGDGREIVLQYPGEVHGQPPRTPQIIDPLRSMSGEEVERRAALLNRLHQFSERSESK